jgi:hypothetical protein
MFRLFGGIGLGAIIAETYERLYNIPLLESRFREEVIYWLSQYNTAKQRLDELSNQLKQSEGEVISLREKVSNLENLYKAKNEEVKKLDELEKESTSAIAFYRERMDNAINNLRKTIERYRAILGDDRVAFESSTIKILEDLKLTQEKLQKVLPYFPLILNFTWKPTKIINDKIYDIKVIFEVISPLNSLREVEVMLIPVDYRYFITKYGMREEDYDKVFPKEEIRSVKIEPKNLEREIFSVDFGDLKGGREYIVKARAKDIAGSEKIVEVKIPYIREFENIANSKDILISAYYYPWYSSNRHWQEGFKGMPLLGRYDSQDQIVISKHIDYATGHGIGAFIVSWWGPNSFEDVTIREYLLKNPLINNIKIQILYESAGRLQPTKENGNEIIIDLDDPTNRNILLNDFNYLADNYFNIPQYLKIGNSPTIQIYLARIFKGDVAGVISSLRKQAHDRGYDLYLVGDLVYWQNPTTPSEKERIKLYDAVTAYNMHTNVREVLNDFESKVAKKYDEWSSVAKDLKVGFIPSALPGFDDSAVRVGNIPLPKSTDRFKKQIKIAKSYIDNNLKTINITTFNEWHEYTYIEPSVEDFFEYLKVLKLI